MGLPDQDSKDRSVVEWQIGRPPRAFSGVASRCSWGFPVVTKQLPQTVDGKPFPTSSYLVCPHLVKMIDRLEADGWIQKLEKVAFDDPAAGDELLAAQKLHAELSGTGRNIGGVADPMRIKCLHAHAAFALALRSEGNGSHALGETVLQLVGTVECNDAKCSAAINR